MKTFLFSTFCFCIVNITIAQGSKEPPNIFIITIDGFRWQEMFNGADPAILNNPVYTKDSSLMQERFGGETAEARRKNLLPFFWSTIAKQGQLYGNRNFNNKVDTKNIYRISYAGYNEIFTGYADRRFIPNTPRPNSNVNLPAYLNTKGAYANKCIAFSSWNIFPYILNEQLNNITVNSGYENMDADDSASILVNEVQDSIVDKSACRHDQLTWLMAKQYLEQHHPKLMVLGFGETDEFAHSGQYDMYLQRANDIDRMIAELWYHVQTDLFYKGNTVFIITTDHGRGKKQKSWPNHHTFVKGSGEIWVAMLGAGIDPKGEIKTATQIYQDQLAQTIAGLAGIRFETNHPTGNPIDLTAKGR